MSQVRILSPRLTENLDIQSNVKVFHFKYVAGARDKSSVPCPPEFESPFRTLAAEPPYSGGGTIGTQSKVSSRQSRECSRPRLYGGRRNLIERTTCPQGPLYEDYGWSDRRREPSGNSSRAEREGVRYRRGPQRTAGLNGVMYRQVLQRIGLAGGHTSTNSSVYRRVEWGQISASPSAHRPDRVRRHS